MGIDIILEMYNQIMWYLDRHMLAAESYCVRNLMIILSAPFCVALSFFESISVLLFVIWGTKDCVSVIHQYFRIVWNVYLPGMIPLQSRRCMPSWRFVTILLVSWDSRGPEILNVSSNANHVRCYFLRIVGRKQRAFMIRFISGERVQYRVYTLIRHVLIV